MIVIRLPDWFFVGGIVTILFAGAVAVWLQLRHMYRRWKDGRYG
jgi:hypothetical protein